jgi:D-arabinose 1-dehydrogenase-like Zn-dependent alcohol dehydrogenase
VNQLVRKSLIKRSILDVGDRRGSAALENFTLTGFGKPLELRCEGEVEPQGDEVLIEVTRCGVCHTDVSIQKGYYELGGGKRYSMQERGMKPPIILGHEIAGRLVAKGQGADDVQIGKSYAVYPWIGCDECMMCRGGQENFCTSPRFHGLQRAGGHAERIVVPNSRYLVDIEGIDPGLAATYACSGLTSYSAIRKLGPKARTENILLIGAGGLGQSALNIALALGFERVTVADIDPVKRELATKAGATDVIDPGDLGDRAVGGQFVGVIDFVGNAKSATLGIEALCRGGIYVIVGLLGGQIELSLPPIALRPIAIVGSLTGTLTEFRELIHLAKTGRLNETELELVPRRLTNEALDRVRQGRIRGRLVLTRET